MRIKKLLVMTLAVMMLFAGCSNNSGQQSSQTYKRK